MQIKRKIKRKIMVLLVAGILVLAMAFSPLAGTEAAASQLDGQEEAEKADNEKADNEKADNGKPDKEETVYVKADALGNVREVTVEALLKNPGGSDGIRDYSTLTDIKNTEGDEEYKEEDQGILIWENHGEDIRYEGKSGKKLPVSVKISYYLDDQPVEPETLAGKSGRFRMRFDYENLTSETVEVDGGSVKTQVPFVVFSAAFLPSEIFSNIEVTNGKVIALEDENIVVGSAYPGLADSLGLSDYEPTKDVELPDYVEISADVADFELAFTATVATTGMFAETDTDELDDADDLIDDMEKLTDASAELVDGTAELLDGVEEFRSYMAQYVDGVSAVNDGAKALADGLGALNEQKTAFETMMTTAVESVQQAVSTAAGELAVVDLNGVEAAATVQARDQAVQALEAALEGTALSDEEKAAISEKVAGSIEVSGVVEAAQDQMTSAQQSLGSLAEIVMPELTAGMTAFDQGIGQLYEGAAALNSGTEELRAAGSKLNDGLAVLSDGVKALCDGMKTFDEDGIQKIADLAGDDLEAVLTRFKALREADGRYDNFSGIREEQKGSVRFIIETDEIQ